MEGITSKQEKIPLDVLAIADKVHMTPIAWNIHPSFVVIVFEQGPKITFKRDPSPLNAEHVVPMVLRDLGEMPEGQRGSKPIAPAIQKFPVRRQKRASLTS